MLINKILTDVDIHVDIHVNANEAFMFNAQFNVILKTLLTLHKMA